MAHLKTIHPLDFLKVKKIFEGEKIFEGKKNFLRAKKIFWGWKKFFEGEKNFWGLTEPMYPIWVSKSEEV